MVFQPHIYKYYVLLIANSTATLLSHDDTSGHVFSAVPQICDATKQTTPHSKYMQLIIITYIHIVKVQQICLFSWFLALFAS